MERPLNPTFYDGKQTAWNHEAEQALFPVTPYLVPSPCRRDAGDHPARGELQQHPHPGVREPHRDGQRDPHPAGGEAVLRGLSRGRPSTSGTLGIRGQDFMERPKGASSRQCLSSSSCGHRPSVALQPLVLFGAQHTQSSGTAGCVSSSFRAEIGVSPWLQPPQEQNDFILSSSVLRGPQKSKS